MFLIQVVDELRYINRKPGYLLCRITRNAYLTYFCSFPNRIAPWAIQPYVNLERF